MKEHGNVLLTGAEKDEIGISVFDVTSVPASFAAENGDVVAKFLKVTADMNAKWLTDSEEMLPVIAKDAGMDEDATMETLDLPVPHRRRAALATSGSARPRPSS
jgi:taurine transport system substrate-binding protein